MIDDLLKLGASKSSILRRFGVRARIDGRAPNVSARNNPSGMTRDPVTGFSQGWDEFFNKPRPTAATTRPAAPISPAPMLPPMTVGDAFAPKPFTLAPDAGEIASLFESSPGLKIDRGTPPPAGYEQAVTNRYMEATRSALGGKSSLTPKAEWDAKFKRRMT